MGIFGDSQIYVGLFFYIASAHLGVVQKWIEDGCIQSPEEMAQILSTLTTRGPFYAAGLVK